MISELCGSAKGFKENSFLSFNAFPKWNLLPVRHNILQQLRTAYPIRAAAVSKRKDRFVIITVSYIPAVSWPPQQRGCMALMQYSVSC